MDKNIIYPLISVIIPIFNTSKYLPRCIDSILIQSYKELEVILVNDGSTDECDSICDKYAQADSRVKVIHKENSGQSEAQNDGIRASTGEFITFVDSDDYIDSNMLRNLFDKALIFNADISVCSYLRVSEFSTAKSHSYSNEKVILLSGIEAMNDLFTANSYVHFETWGKLYKAWLFKQTDIRFPSGYLSGDQFTTYKLLFHAQKVVCFNQQLYFYTHRHESITGSPFNAIRLNVLEAGRQAIEFVKDNKLQLEEQAWCFYIGLNIYLINQILKDVSRHQWMEILKELRMNVLTASVKVNARCLLPKQRLISIFLLRLGYWCYMPVRKLWVKREDRQYT